MTPYATIELFHLLFLRHLENKLDKRLYALKGGCNLRFFFKSIRYSDDIDFDIATVAKTTLENKVSKILESVDFKKILRSKHIEIAQINPAKQTDTTQRWKLLLRVENLATLFPTKIEFSRRKMNHGVMYEEIDSDLIHQYHLYPILCNHYQMNTAFLQKCEALVGRVQTQTRDVFDLKWLADHGAHLEKNAAFSQEKISHAIKIITELNYSAYKSQVVAFLMNEYQHIYDSKEKWHEIQKHVITTLRGKRDETH